ncbi:MAG TPA: DNA (cytosine-5-)-methyltransferase, partial [Gammaproteobacteria bacterium]|nr:DNA (cytosine-5-)-methyltransferase [Gammaproteobacteria bacterium]
MPSKTIKNKDIPIIDLFAGPGGLSEGFAAYATKSGKVHPFSIRASVEMDMYAHQTLELRSFYHEFDRENIPDEYYQYLRHEITREELFGLYPTQAAIARERAIKATLGDEEDDKLIYERLDKVLSRYANKPWVLVGGPPCQAYSTIGRSRRQINSKGQEAHEKDKRNFLYRQYLRTIARYKPTIFVMENVKGMLSAKVNGERIFYKILSDLQKPNAALDEVLVGDNLEYKIYSLVVSKDEGVELDPTDYLIQSEQYGVPQARHRVILLGVRGDVDAKPGTLKKHLEKIGVKRLIGDLPVLRSSFTRVLDNEKEWYDFLSGVTRQVWFKSYKPAVPGSNSVDAQEFRLKMHEHLNKVKKHLDTGGEFVEADCRTEYRPDWFNDRRLGGVLNHEARGHMKEDLYRYFFASAFAESYGRSPRMKDFPMELLPKHKNVADALSKGVFDDRFRVQEATRPAATITCHIAKDGHYSIHYDPTQCRSLTVREAARLQSFPDNYYFVGPRSQQYKQ